MDLKKRWKEKRKGGRFFSLKTKKSLHLAIVFYSGTCLLFSLLLSLIRILQYPQKKDLSPITSISIIMSLFASFFVGKVLLDYNLEKSTEVIKENEDVKKVVDADKIYSILIKIFTRSFISWIALFLLYFLANIGLLILIYFLILIT